jgi:flavin-dependent thymidylate synthase
MKVSLISYTADARELLLFTKQTRLSMDSGLMAEIKRWPEEKKQAELNYMLGTIQSSWEFCDYTFSIEEVSRAFTHQLVRTDAPYAQQSQRTVDMSEFDYVTPDAIAATMIPLVVYRKTMEEIAESYAALIDMGVNPQDARGVLPTNVCTNIIAKFDLRTLHYMARLRLCTRTQGEYQNVFRAMREEVIKVHPWAEPFIRVACAAEGVCCFPNYQECPIKPGVFNPDTGRRWDAKDYDGIYVRPMTKQEIQVKWEGTKFEAVPKQMRPDSTKVLAHTGGVTAQYMFCASETPTGPCCQLVGHTGKCGGSR